MKYLTIVILLALMGCNPTRQAVRKLNRIQIKHPELFQAYRDTVIRSRELTIPVPVLRFDSVITLYDDTGTFRQPNLKIQVIRDTIDRYRTIVEYEPDSIIVTVTDTVVRVDTRIATEYVEKNKGYKTFAWIVIVIVVIVFLFKLISTLRPKIKIE